jgi:hypothetical protein
LRSNLCKPPPQKFAFTIIGLLQLKPLLRQYPIPCSFSKKCSEGTENDTVLTWIHIVTRYIFRTTTIAAAEAPICRNVHITGYTNDLLSFACLHCQCSFCRTLPGWPLHWLLQIANRKPGLDNNITAIAVVIIHSW